jgi:hypothetical protein
MAQLMKKPIRALNWITARLLLLPWLTLYLFPILSAWAAIPSPLVWRHCFFLLRLTTLGLSDVSLVDLCFMGVHDCIKETVIACPTHPNSRCTSFWYPIIHYLIGSGNFWLPKRGSLNYMLGSVKFFFPETCFPKPVCRSWMLSNIG